MGCNDLCTAAKCEELENKINQLEAAFQELEADFALHLSQDIPEAHAYNAEDKPDIDESSPVNVSVTARGDNTFLVTVKVGSSQDSDGFTVNVPEIPEPPDPVEPEVSVAVFELGQDNYGISVQVGTKQGQDSFTITHPEIPELKNDDNDQHVKSNLNGSASFNNGTLIITIADGESSDTFQVNIPTNESPQTIFITEEVYMNCDQLENKFDNCCGQIIGALSTLSTQLANVESAINTEVKQVYESVTIDVKGKVNSSYKCEFPTNENTEEIITTYAESKSEEIDLTKLELKGLSGIYEYLKIMAGNLNSIHVDVCKAVDPILTITTEDLFKHCLSLDIKREDYADDSQGDIEYQAAQDAYLNQLLSESKYGSLIANKNGNNLITAPSNWTHQILTDFALIQGKINNTAICAIEPGEQGDVVSIVASDAYITRATGKYLVLHFVELDNYPKRSNTASFWQIQIPAAKESYVWNDDFANLRFKRGNQFAQLKFNEFKTPVKGYFQDEAAANSYFDAVLGLTTATEKNRVIPKHKNPQTAVATRETRPYRAFINSVNSQGQAVCHVKYIPPKKNE